MPDIQPTDFSVSNTGNIRRTGATTVFDVFDLHKWLQDLADNDGTTGDDLVDITSPNPSRLDGPRDTLVASRLNLLSSGSVSFNIDSTTSQYFKFGSIKQDNGNTQYSGLKTIGSIVASSPIYVTQNNAKLTKFWSNGHIQILLLVRSGGSLIANGDVTVFSRKYGQSYSHFDANLSGGGESSAALSTAIDTAVTLTEVQAAALSSKVTITVGDTTQDLSNGNGPKLYKGTIALSGGCSLQEAYQYLQYITREDSTTTINGEPGWRYRKLNSAYSENVAAPFGSFAGGTFFVAQGWFLSGVLEAESGKYQLIAHDGTTQSPLQIVALKAPNFASGTRAYAARVQTFTIASTAINTSTDTITLGNDSQGNPPVFAYGSESFFTWVRDANRGVLTAGITSPIGAATAQSLTAGTDNFGYLYRSSATTNGTQYVFSFYAKAGTCNFVWLEINNARPYINLTTLAVSQSAGIALSANLISDGWVEVIAIFTANATTTTFAIGGSNATGNQAMTSGTNILIWGPQISTTAAAPWTQVSFRLTSGATLPSTTGGTLVDGGFYYWSGGKLYTSIANIPATPIDFTSQGSGNFTLQAETELFNTVVSGGSGLSQVLSEPTGQLIRLKAAYWAKDNNGLASAGAFFDNRDNLIAWSSTGGVSLGATVGPSNLETVHEAIVSTAQIQSNKYGLLSAADSGDTLTQFSIALEGIGTLQINSNDPDGIELIQNIFLWWCWIRSTQAGIRLASYDTLQAINFTSYQAGRVEVENTNSALPLNLAGGSVTFPRTSSGIAQGSFAINLNADVFGTGATVTTGGISPSATDIRNAVGLTAPNLDNQLTGISTKTSTLPASFPANFSDLAITASTGRVTAASVQGNVTGSVGSITNPVTVGTNNDKTGYSLATPPPTTAQIRTELATELARLDVAVSTRLAASGYTTPPTTAQIATAVEAALLNDADGQALLAAIQTAVQALFDQQADIPVATLVNLIAAQITADHGSGSYTTANTAALALETSVQAIKTKTDAIPANPLLTTDTRLNNLDTTVSSRASQTSVSAIPTTPAPTAAQNASQVRTELGTELARLDVAVSSRSTLTAGDIPAGLSAQQVWEYATRQLTGTQATNLAAIPNIPTNPLLASAYTPPPSAGTIAGAVWDEILSQHLGVGSTGAKLNLTSTLTVGDIPAGLTAAQVWTYTGGDRSLSGAQANSLAITLATTQAVAKGKFVIDYAASTATQYNTDGTVLQVFDLQDKDGNPATSAQTAVKRVPR